MRVMKKILSMEQLVMKRVIFIFDDLGDTGEYVIEIKL